MMSLIFVSMHIVTRYIIYSHLFRSVFINSALFLLLCAIAKASIPLINADLFSLW